MKQIIERLGSPMPDFWKRVRVVMITIGVIGGAIISVPSSIVDFPFIIDTIAGYMIAIGIVGTALSQLTKK